MTRQKKLNEECGIFGVYNHPDASTLVTLGLHALQHRGQEACGINSFDGKNFFSVKRRGLVGDNFTDKKIIKQLPGHAAIGHNRYSTTGAPIVRNIQPFFADLHSGGISIAHNGNLTNAIEIREKMVKEGSIFQTTSDTETIVQLIAKSKRLKTIDKIIDAVFQIHGGYAITMLTSKKLIGIRDPPRSEAYEAIATCHEAGIRVIMITGDQEYTAKSVGIELEICDEDSETISGYELDSIDDFALIDIVQQVNIFCRVTPDQKMRIVQALQKIEIKVPIVIRLAGTNVEKGNKILKESKIKYIEANTLEDAANKAVKALGN